LENGKPNFSSAGEEWRILREGFTACLLFLTRGGELCLIFHRRPPVSHPGRGTLLDSLRRPQRGVTPFSMEKLSYWLLFFLILHSSRTHSPTSEKCDNPYCLGARSFILLCCASQARLWLTFVEEFVAVLNTVSGRCPSNIGIS
jgi:hypothetical protein